MSHGVERESTVLLPADKFVEESPSPPNKELLPPPHQRGRYPNPATSKLPTFGLRYLCADCEAVDNGVGAMVAS
jgi:hypothetical protein